MSTLWGAYRDRTLLALAFAAVWFIWGSTYLALAWGIESIPPVLMIAARSLIAGGVLYGWTRLRGAPRPAASDWRRMTLAGVLLFVTGQAVLTWAETRVASGPAAVLIATEPVFIALLGWKGGALVGRSNATSRPPVPVLAAMVAGLGGLALMVAPGTSGALDPLGAAALVLASFSWSVGAFHAKPRPGLAPVQAAGMQLLTAGVVLSLIALVNGEVASFDASALTTRSLAAFLYLVVFGSIVTYAAYVWLLERVGPARLSSHAYVNPVVAVALGAWLAGERLTPSLVVAMAVILASVVVLVRWKAARAEEPAVVPLPPAQGEKRAAAA